MPDDEIIFGKNAVLAFLEDADRQAVDSEAKSLSKPPDINKIFVAPTRHVDRRLERIKKLARDHRIPVVVCEMRKLDQMVGDGQAHQGVAAQISPVEFMELDDFIERISAGLQLSPAGACLVAVVDGIEDPHNLGAIIRVAESAGVRALLLPIRRSAGLTGIVAKTSAGAIATLPIVRIHNIVLALTKLKKAGFWVAGLDAHEGQVYYKADLVRPLALIVGSEGKGMGRLVKENCDLLLQIPMLGKTESLNASVAAGIVFYEAVRQMQSDGP